MLKRSLGRVVNGRTDIPVPYLDLEEPLFRPEDVPGNVRPPEGLLTPLLIPAPYGRAGSTALMELLASSSQVAFERIHPYEERHLTYFVHWAQLLGRSQAPERGWHAGTLFEERVSSVMPFPMKAPTLRRDCSEYGKLWEHVLTATWKEFSRFAQTNQQRRFGCSLPVTYYAEKIPTWAFDIVRRLFPTKTIYLLRDPRDVWLSGLAFDKKRRLRAFGPQHGQTKRAHAEAVALRWKPRLRAIVQLLKAENSGAEYVLRYEDLLSDLQCEAERLGSWLGVVLDPNKSGNSDEKRTHMTSKSVASSRNRWKRELSASLNDVFVAILRDELVELGYDLR